LHLSSTRKSINIHYFFVMWRQKNVCFYRKISFPLCRHFVRAIICTPFSGDWSHHKWWTLALLFLPPLSLTSQSSSSIKCAVFIIFEKKKCKDTFFSQRSFCQNIQLKIQCIHEFQTQATFFLVIPYNIW
jgi:hypothetical protein